MCVEHAQNASKLSGAEAQLRQHRSCTADELMPVGGETEQPDVQGCAASISVIIGRASTSPSRV